MRFKNELTRELLYDIIVIYNDSCKSSITFQKDKYIMRTSDQIKAEIIERFGFFPPFFEPAITTPGILENLWQQTLSAYVDNPIPQLFKEKLFAYLSRYCSVPYCIICHSCALRPMKMSARDLLEILKKSAPYFEEDIADNINILRDITSQLDKWPEQDSVIEESIFICSVLIFLNPAGSDNCRTELRRTLGTSYYNYLIEFISYVKTCHIWVEAHPELSYEADKRAIDNLADLIHAEPSLSDFFKNYNEKVMHEQKKQKEQLIATLSELRKAYEKLQLTQFYIDKAEDFIALIRPDGLFTYINEKAIQMFGYTREEFLNMAVYDIDPSFSKEEWPGMWQDIKQHGSLTFETFPKKKDGTLVPIEVRATYVEFGGQEYMVSFARDITKRKFAEETLKRYYEEFEKIQRIESIGLLAGGIAHDFNNLLTSILGNISLAKTELDPNSNSYMRLEKAESASVRATGLTQQLLTFSRGGEPLKKASSVSELLKDSIKIALSGSKSRCDFSIPDNLWPVYVDEGQINQVFNNMIINADQAMPDGGTIQVICENVTIAKDEIIPLPGGKYVKVSIKDDGIGIPEAYLIKIFDPYFTTKERGKGLGLTSCFSIIRRHGGYITVESSTGTGTTFHIYLAAMPDKTYIDKGNAPQILTGTGKILIMDDEEDIRVVAREMLETLGYNPETACDGEEAIEKYKIARDSGRPFDAVIMDLTIPGRMGGKEAIKKLKELSPSVKAIVSSGYANDLIIANYKDYGFTSILTKPYTIQNLSTVLNDIING
ncbi:MAG: ATP-binding protein [Nitrospira sp.]|nr:ATP-binding protein [Nitrospira sp.]